MNINEKIDQCTEWLTTYAQEHSRDEVFLVTARVHAWRVFTYKVDIDGRYSVAQVACYAIMIALISDIAAENMFESTTVVQDKIMKERERLARWFHNRPELKQWGLFKMSVKKYENAIVEITHRVADTYEL